MKTEDVASVLDREFRFSCPPPGPSYIVHSLSRPPDEVFFAKHMPDLGYDVKQLQVFHWKLQDWKKLGRKQVSPEFDCGGHKWHVFPTRRRPSQSLNLKAHLGRYFSSRPAILSIQATPSPSISIVPDPRTRKMIGTHARSSRWQSQIHTILLSTPSTVRTS